MVHSLSFILLALPLLTVASNSHNAPAHRRHHANIAARDDHSKRGGAVRRCKPRSSSIVSSTVSASSVSVATTSHAAATTSKAAEIKVAETTTSKQAGTTSYEAPSTTKAATTYVPTTTITTSAAAITTKASTGNFTPPNGRKAGLAGGNAFDYVKGSIGWWYDWTPKPLYHSGGGTIAVPMLWGAGSSGSSEDASRMASYKSNVLNTNTAPTYLLGFNEPDCSGSASAGMTPQAGAELWKSLIAPVANRGTLLGSPAMCMQSSETWLTPFEAALGGSRSWDFTAVHIYTDNMADVKKTLDHYAKYGRPMWITEFGCVHTGFTPCYSQSDIDAFIYGIVDVFEADSRVHAYGYTDGGGLGNLWLPTNGGYGTGLSASGKTYSYAIAKYA